MWWRNRDDVIHTYIFDSVPRHVLILHFYFQNLILINDHSHFHPLLNDFTNWNSLIDLFWLINLKISEIHGLILAQNIKSVDLYQGEFLRKSKCAKTPSWQWTTTIGSIQYNLFNIVLVDPTDDPFILNKSSKATRKIWTVESMTFSAVLSPTRRHARLGKNVGKKFRVRIVKVKKVC